MLCCTDGVVACCCRSKFFSTCREVAFLISELLIIFKKGNVMAKKKVAEKVKEANPVDQKKQTVTSKNKDGEEEITAHQ